MYYDIGAYDMLFSEFSDTCHKAWCKKLTTHVLIWVKTKMKLNIVFSMRAKTHTLKVFVKVKLFSFLNVICE